MGKLKQVLFDGLVGGMLGGGLADLVAPRFLTWYNIPGSGEALCPCREVALSTAHLVVQAQLIGSGVGALLCVVGSFLLRSPKAGLVK